MQRLSESEEPDIYDAVAEFRGRQWLNEWPTVDGFYWLRGWRYYTDLPIKVEGDTFWMMFNASRNHKKDLDDSPNVQFQGPIIPFEGR